MKTTKYNSFLSLLDRAIELGLKVVPFKDDINTPEIKIRESGDIEVWAYIYTILFYRGDDHMEICKVWTEKGKDEVINSIKENIFSSSKTPEYNIQAEKAAMIFGDYELKEYINRVEKEQGI
jgi:hypothetical protein